MKINTKNKFIILVVFLGVTKINVIPYEFNITYYCILVWLKYLLTDSITCKESNTFFHRRREKLCLPPSTRTDNSVGSTLTKNPPPRQHVKIGPTKKLNLISGGVYRIARRRRWDGGISRESTGNVHPRSAANERHHPTADYHSPLTLMLIAIESMITWQKDAAGRKRSVSQRPRPTFQWFSPPHAAPSNHPT